MTTRAAPLKKIFTVFYFDGIRRVGVQQQRAKQTK
jgi:hypothetical protein